MNTIRLADPNDLERVITIVRNATRKLDAHGIAQWDELYPNRSDLQTDIENRHLYVIETGDAAAGLIALNEDQSPEYGEIAWQYRGTVLVVHRLVVDPAFQGQRLASQLMDFAEQTAATAGYAAIRLDAFSQNPTAIALYERRGYRRAGTVRLRKGLFFCFEKPFMAQR